MDPQFSCSKAETLSDATDAIKVLFILPNVAVGGVERVRLTLIQQFVADGIECRLALRRCRGELIDRARSLAPVDELAPRGLFQFIPSLIRLIRREQPSHIITAFSDVAMLAWIAILLSRWPVKWVHSVHNTHSMIGSRPGAWGRMRYRLENRMAGFAYRRADAVVAVSEGVRREILDWYHINPKRVTTIYNPAVPDDQLRWRRPLRRMPADPFRIIAVGRLVRQKGFDVLIRSMAEVAGSWRLDIWGEGAERSNLEAAIEEARLQDKIRLRGYTADPYAVLREADLFVMSSRHEGLPATLIEAMACQCQIVATDCLHGPREILKEGQLGQLVPAEDHLALAGAIAKVVCGAYSVEPELLRARAQDFSKSACCSNWEAILRNSD